MTISENISWKKLQDKVVAVNITNGVYYTMNGVASQIWSLIADNKSLDEIAEDLTKTYADVDPATIKADLDEQIAYWKQEKMLA